MIEKHNLFHSIPADLPEEFTERLVVRPGQLRIERIVSRGHASPPDFWYCQDTSEFVLLLRGSATVEFADPEKSIDLARGDWLEIPAKVKHRVEKTSDAEDTVWFAVHYESLSIDETTTG